MSKKIFVSYKYSDRQVLQLDPLHEITTARDYVDIIESYLQEDYIYKGESDDEDLSHLSDITIEGRLRDRIYDSTVTIVMISKGMKTLQIESEQWIPWEISYSLKETTRNDRTSHSNAMLAIALPDEHDSYEYIVEQKGHPICKCSTWKTNLMFRILGNNMFNIKSKSTHECTSGICGQMFFDNNHSYIEPIKWDEFMKNKELYINLAVERKQNINNYDIRKVI